MSPDLPTILIVEDHCATRRFLADNLAADGYEPLEACTAAAACRLLAQRAPELAIIDLGLPDRDGLDLLGELRAGAASASAIDPGTPVLVLSGRAGEIDRVRGFERGCDDYLVKPFSYPELRARLVALQRRLGGRQRVGQGRGQGRIRVGGLEIDPVSRAAWVEGDPIALSKKEWALLRALAAEPTRVFTREELLGGVWGFPSGVPTRTLDSHASRLRQKLSRGNRRYVVNVWGVGYRLIDAPPR